MLKKRKDRSAVVVFCCTAVALVFYFSIIDRKVSLKLKYNFLKFLSDFTSIVLLRTSSTSLSYLRELEARYIPDLRMLSSVRIKQSVSY